MKKTKHLLLTLALLICAQVATAQGLDINDGGWSITYDASQGMPTSNTLTFTQNGKVLLKGVYMTAINAANATLTSKSYPTVNLSKTSVNDQFGVGTKYTYTYSGLAGKENLEQVFYIYPANDYMLVQGNIVAASGTTKTNYIAPIVSTSSSTFLPSAGYNVVYTMPFDNDSWRGYAANPFQGVSYTSCEVSGAYNVASRNGLIVGSIEHDNWKSGITIKTNSGNALTGVTVFAGMASALTNDVTTNNPSMPVHGSISGARVSSPRYFFGYYADWRTGLETLGDATATLCPKQEWTGGSIFGWNSWGGMAQWVNSTGVMDVANFFVNQMMSNNFYNENGTCYLVLDSYWDNFTDAQLSAFVQYCKANGMHAGIYHTPFSYWGNSNDAANNRPYNGSPYTYAQMALRANGQIRTLDNAVVLDPTHPGTIEYNRQRFEKFKTLGFEYVKLDFINSGALESDSHYDAGVTTGMQAYSQGMDKVLEQCAGMFVDLSISPVFPAKGNARRISCDSWGQIDNSMYTLSNLELGWWLDRVYNFNDPDHLVLSQSGSDGAARIRYTTGVTMGCVVMGDNYSLTGSYVGFQSYRDLALRIASNPAVNAVAQLGKSFRPVEGSMQNPFNLYQYSFGVGNEFTLDTPDALYYVVYNYDFKNTGAAFTKQADFARIGIDAANAKAVTELWTGANIPISGGSFAVSVPKADVCIYRIDKLTAGIEDVEADNKVDITANNGLITATSAEPISSLSVYGIDGKAVSTNTFSDNNRTQTAELNGSNTGIYIVTGTLRSGKSFNQKIHIK